MVKATGDGWIYSTSGEDVAFVMTNRIASDDLAHLQDVEIAPLTIQREVPKAYEVRVNVVGREVLAIRIESQRSTVSELDWRRYDLGNTPYLPYQLPHEVEERCRKLVCHLGLEFGAIDLIRTPDGEYVFLEINGNGQFLWAENLSGVRVSAALARLLVGTAPPIGSGGSTEWRHRMLNESPTTRVPFLFRFKETEPANGSRPLYASPERGGESNPKEEAPRPEPTRKGPWGD